MISKTKKKLNKSDMKIGLVAGFGDIFFFIIFSLLFFYFISNVIEARALIEILKDLNIIEKTYKSTEKMDFVIYLMIVTPFSFKFSKVAMDRVFIVAKFNKKLFNINEKMKKLINIIEMCHLEIENKGLSSVVQNDVFLEYFKILYKEYLEINIYSTELDLKLNNDIDIIRSLLKGDANAIEAACKEYNIELRDHDTDYLILKLLNVMKIFRVNENNDLRENQWVKIYFYCLKLRTKNIGNFNNFFSRILIKISRGLSLKPRVIFGVTR